MKTIKRTVSLLIAALFMLTVFPISASAATPEFSFSSTINASNQVVLSVDLKNANDFNAITFSITYDSVLQPVSATEANEECSVNLNGSTGIIVSAYTQDNAGVSVLHLAEIVFNSTAPKSQNEAAIQTAVKIAQANGAKVTVADVTYTVQLHDYNDWTVVTPSTCTQKGTSQRVCKICGNIDTRSDAINANNHSFKNYVYNNDATCDADGTKTAVCEYGCGKTDTVQADGTAKGHSYGAWVSTGAEKHQRVCANDSKHVETAAHTFGDPVRQNPTCTAVGYDVYTCTACGFERKDQIDMLPHNPLKLDAVPATCTAAGLTEGSVCADCGTILTAQTEIPALGHDYQSAVTTAATCTAAGVMTYTCSRCEDTYTETIPMIAHTPETIPAVAASCTSDGSTQGSKCAVCGTILTATEPVAALGHDYKLTATVDATCTAEGSRTFTCTRCEDSYTETIEKLAHTPRKLAAKAATCTEAGLTEGSECAVCGTILTAQETIPMLAHTPEAIPGKAATCTQTGQTEGSKCSVCGTILTAQETIPTIAHTPEAIPGKAATCTETGLSDGSKCSVCGTILTAQETIPTIPHTPEAIPGKAATCTETGLSEGSKCSVCGAILTAQETLPKIDHTPETIPGKAATCTETGLSEGSKCSVCGEILTAQKTIPTIAHTPEAIPGKAATCTETGLSEGSKCAVCGAILTEQKTLPVKEHADSDGDGKCDECGETLVSTLRGDANLDGKVLANDARLVLRASAKLETIVGQGFVNCDLNNDGKLLANEARKILRYSAKLEKEL